MHGNRKFLKTYFNLFLLVVVCISLPLQGFSQDQWDPDDNMVLGATILDGMPNHDAARHGTHTLSPSDPADWFQITLKNGYDYQFSSEGDTDAILSIYSDPRSVALASSTNSNGGFSLTYNPKTAGNFYLKVSGTQGFYTLCYANTMLYINPIKSIDGVFQSSSYSADSQLFLLSKLDRILLCNANTFEMINRLDDASTGTYTLPIVFSPDGRKILYGATKGYSTLLYSWEFSNNWGDPSNIAYRDTFAVLTNKRILINGVVYDLTTGKETSLRYPVYDKIQVSSDGTKILGLSSGTVCLVDALTGQLGLQYRCNDAVTELELSNDMKMIAISTLNYILLIDAQTGKILKKVNRYEGYATNNIHLTKLTPDGAYLLFRCSLINTERIYAVYEINTGRIVRYFLLNGNRNKDVDDINISPDGKRVIISGDFGAKIWDISDLTINRFAIPENSIVVTDDLHSSEDLTGKFDMDSPDSKALGIRWNFDKSVYTQYHVYAKVDSGKEEFISSVGTLANYYLWTGPEFGHSYTFVIYGIRDDGGTSRLESKQSVYFMSTSDNTPTPTAPPTATYTPTSTYTPTNTPTPTQTYTPTQTPVLFSIPDDTIAVTDDMQSTEDLLGKYDADSPDQKALAIRWKYKGSGFTGFHIYVIKEEGQPEFIEGLPAGSMYYVWKNPEFGHTYRFRVWGVLPGGGQMLETTKSVLYLSNTDPLPSNTPTQTFTPTFTETFTPTLTPTFTPSNTPTPTPVLFDIPENSIVVTDDLQSRDDLLGKFDADSPDGKALGIRWKFKDSGFSGFHIYIIKDEGQPEFLNGVPAGSTYFLWSNPEFGHSYRFRVWGVIGSSGQMLETAKSVLYISSNDPTPANTPTPADTPSSTPTAVFTATYTPTFTATVTNTPAATNTFTPTATMTFTPISTNTPIDAYTSTPTVMITFTPTNTFTPAATMTFTPTVTNTPAPVVTPKPNKDDILTLAIISKSRLVELYGADRVAVFMAKLETLLAHETVRGEIADLDQFSSLRDKFKIWDADSNNLAQDTQADPRENIKKANILAETIKGVVGSRRSETKYAKVKYAVIIGSDAVIPFYRTKNPSRATSSEFNYYKTLDRTHPLAAALSQDYVLSDDFYANAAPSWMNKETDLELYLPNDLMIGRLVETPEEMGTMIDAYLSLQGQTDFNKAMVAGSDTYANGADMAVSILKADMGRINQLPTEGDDPLELADALKNLNPLNVLGLYGTHAKIFRTKKVSPLSAKSAKNYIKDMHGAIVMNWGGHGGLNLDRRLVDPSKEYENLASVFCNMGVGAYLGTTAFAGSSQKSIGFSELLGLRMIDALVSGTNSMTIGEAYNKAKQEYWLNESNGLAKSSLDLSEVIQNVADDTKVLSGMVLYGLPMFRVTSSEAGKVTPLSLSKEWENSLSMRMAKVKPKAIGKGLFEVQLKGSLEDTFMKENTTDAGKYYSFNGVTQTNVNEPVQPRISFFTGAESFFPKGAVLESAKYDTIPNFDPVIEGGEWGSDTAGEGTFNKKGFFPAIPFTVNTIAKSETVPPLQKFIFIAGQYNNENKTERLYRELRYTTYYTGEQTDNTTPIINEPTVNIGNQAKITVQGWDKDADPLYRVVLVWTDGQGQWKSVDLEKSSSNSKEWSTEIAVKADMVFFLQAVDTLGNVAYLDNQGQYYQVKSSQQEPKWNYVDFAPMLKLDVKGYTSPDLQIASVPTDNAFDNATDGQGLKVVLQPGQGVLLLASAPVSAGNGLVELKTSVRTTSKDIQLGLVAVAVPDSGPDDSLGYVNPTGNEVPVNKWGEMDLVYDCPAKNYFPAIQFVLPKEAASAQTVYFDNLRYGDYASKAGNPVTMAFDTTFDTINSNLETLNPFIFLDPSFSKGEIALASGQNKQGVLFTLLPNISNQVSRIGGYFSAPPEIPSLIETTLYVKKESADDDGMFTLAILDGEQTIMYKVNAKNLPLNQFKQIRIGGNFSDPGQLVGPVVVIQHAGSGKAGKIIFDDLSVVRN